MNFFQRKPSEQDIVEGIRLGGTKRQGFENKLYENYRYLIRDATYKHKLSEEEASMAYSDTILTVIEHIGSGRFEQRSSLKTYVYQIFYNKCVDALRKISTNAMMSQSLDTVLEPLRDPQRSVILEIIRKQDHEKLSRLLKTLGDRCQELLSRWAGGFTDKESAIEYGYSTAAVAQTTRLRCLDKLKEMYGK